LVVDDDRAVGRAIARCLRIVGFEPSLSASASDALAVFERGERFCLVVSDIQMPGLDGHAFREAARRCWPEIDAVLVFVTGGCLEPPAAIPCFEKPLRQDFREHVRGVFDRACRRTD
jgi:DNA-binding NtrC family response regulator